MSGTRRNLPKGGSLIRRARRRAGLTQKELAELLSTSQSLVARWENGIVEPPFETVIHAVRTCGLDVSLGLFTYDDQHDALIDSNLRLSPKDRLERMLQSRDALDALRHSAKRKNPADR